jgi:hypothetical protein
MATAVAAPGFTFDEASHTYRDEHQIVVPSVTQLLKSEGFINFDGVPFSVLERKRRLGSLVHQATELWDRGEDLNQFDIPEAAWPYIEGYFHFVEDTKFQPVVIEERRLAVVRGMRYGMTPDRRGALNGVPHVIELKCGASTHPAWGLQLAAYDLGTHQKQQEARAALQLGPQFARGYKLHPYDEAADYTVWINALANDVWKRNKKIAQYEDVPERLY